MADLYLNLSQVNDLCWEATVRMLGYDPNDRKQASQVRLSWPPQGAPGWKQTEDVVFLRVEDQDDSINKQIDTQYAQSGQPDYASQISSYTRVLIVHWTLYGPNSFDRAFMLRNLLQEPQYLNLFKAKNLYLIPEVKSPVRAPELYAGHWWERTDMSVRFNETIVFNGQVPYLQSAEVTRIDQYNFKEKINVTKGGK